MDNMPIRDCLKLLVPRTAYYKELEIYSLLPVGQLHCVLWCLLPAGENVVVAETHRTIMLIASMNELVQVVPVKEEEKEYEA